jgi:16S rRNA (cytosine1402-N4)-methyltransferase
MRALGFGPESFTALRQNFAGLPRALAAVGVVEGADVMLADLGVSSMQLDRPERGFSVKLEGPLDMRMNPARGLSAGQLLERSKPEGLAALLVENSEEPHAAELARLLAEQRFETTVELANAVRRALASRPAEEAALSVRRIFQALRIAVNDEFGALETLLRHLPACLRPGGRAAILTFHSGEDRRVKRAFAEGVRSGVFAEASRVVTRAQSPLGAAHRLRRVQKGSLMGMRLTCVTPRHRSFL